MNRSDRGFTLIEVMATLAILSIALVILIKGQTRSLNNVMRVQTYERAVFITENNLHWTFLDLNEAESWEEYADLEGEDGDYLWRVTIQPAEMEREGDLSAVMLKIIATTTWTEGRSDQEFSLETWYLWGEENE